MVKEPISKRKKYSESQKANLSESQQQNNLGVANNNNNNSNNNLATTLDKGNNSILHVNNGINITPITEIPQKHLSEHNRKPHFLVKKFMKCPLFLWIILSILVIFYATTYQQVNDTVLNVAPMATKYIPDIDEMEFFEAHSIVGSKLREKGYTPNFRLIAMPGYLTTQLEMWEAKACMSLTSRRRIWGGLNMIGQILKDRQCWIEHLMLGEDGSDPPNVKLRPIHGGLDAVDYLFPGFWVWARITTELGGLGYTSNEINIASYDWRLGLEQLEERDGYFTRLKSNVEVQKKLSKGKKVVIIAHSWGSLIYLHFMQWVTRIPGNSKWVDEHIEAFINIAGPLLGLSKAFSAMLSGEMRDTTTFMMQNFLENIFSAETRMLLFRSWTSAFHLLPKGGSKIWGTIMTSNDTSVKDVTGDNYIDFLLSLNSTFIHKNIVKLNESRDFSNPLTFPLPYAPNMKIYCFYGTNLTTETSYVYTKSPRTGPADGDSNTDWKIYTDVNGENIVNGVAMTTEGDGTVPLLSLSLMCSHLWRDNRWNPSGSKVVTVELENRIDENGKLHFRGGGKSNDHVDIMGNEEMIEMISKIAAGSGEEVQDRFISNIKNMKIPDFPSPSHTNN